MSILLAVIALFWLYTLSNRLDRLEKQIGGKVTPVPEERSMTGVERAAHDVLVAERMKTQHVSPQTTLVPEPATVMSSEDDVLSRFIRWVRIDFMMKLGAFFILCAFGWFVSYAFMNNLIGEAGRIALGLITGAAFMVGGYFRMRISVHQGGVFTVLGSSTILLTVYAARELYDFFTPFTALGMMFLTVAFVAFVSVRMENRTLALVGLVLASIAPFFTSDPYPDVTERFAYLLVIVLGSLWVVYLRGWSVVTLSALIVVFLHSLPYINPYTGRGDTDIVLLFTFVFVAIFFVANILGLIANENDENHMPHLIIALLTTVFLILWVGVAADPEWRSLLYVAWMLVYSLGSFIVYRHAERPEAFYIYSGTSIALLAAATAEELTGPALTIAYTFEVSALVLVATSVLKNARVGAHLSWLFLFPTLLAFESIVSSEWSRGILHGDFFVIVTLMFALMVSGISLREGVLRGESDDADMSTSLLVIAGVFSIILIWLVLHAGQYVSEDTATLLALVIYTLLGLFFFHEARETGVRAWRYAGGALIALVVARLLLIEVWNMALSGRIITFFVIGMLLLSTAFLKRKKDVFSNQ